jgi:FMN phosphatase YigB (HAD superfamily)
MVSLKKVVLVDFDGVVLRNKTADIQVAKRAGIYTWRKMNSIKSHDHNLISPKQAEDVNYNLYKGYGHTLTGLKHTGIPNCHMKDYNKLVYDTIDYEKARSSNNNFDDLRVLINYCLEHHHEIYFFSNAPFRWMNNLLKNDQDILSSVDDIRKVLKISEDDETYLKPYSHIYDKINSHFNKENIIFIDDNIGNIRPVMNNVAWTNILFCSVNKKINNKLYFIDDLVKSIDIV